MRVFAKMSGLRPQGATVTIADMRQLINAAMLVTVLAWSGSYRLHAITPPPKAGARHVEPCVFVRGEVRVTGRYNWIDGMTVIDAIQAAGGFTDKAGRRVRISRVNGISEIYDRDDSRKPTLLKAGDRIYVPKKASRLL